MPSPPPGKWIILCSKENTYLGCLGKLGKVSKHATAGIRVTTCHFIHTVFCYFVSFSQILVFPRRLCSKPIQHILDIVDQSHATLNFEKHIKQAGQLTELLLLFYENKPEGNKGSSKHLRFR